MSSDAKWIELLRGRFRPISSRNHVLAQTPVMKIMGCRDAQNRSCVAGGVQTSNSVGSHAQNETWKQLWLVEKHGALHTSDFLLVDRIDISQHRVLARGLCTSISISTNTSLKTSTYHLLWDIDLFRQGHGSFLQWTRQVDLTDVVAKIGLLLDECDQPVFDLKEDGGTRINIFGEGAIRDNV